MKKIFEVDIKIRRSIRVFDDKGLYKVEAHQEFEVTDDTKLDEIMDIPIGKLILGSAYKPKEETTNLTASGENHSDGCDCTTVSNESLRVLFDVSDIIQKHVTRLINQPEAFAKGYVSEYIPPRYNNCTTWLSKNHIWCANDHDIDDFYIIATTSVVHVQGLITPITIKYKSCISGLEVSVIEIDPIAKTIKFPLYPTQCYTSLLTQEAWCKLAYELEKCLEYKLAIGNEFDYIADKIEELRNADIKGQEDEK